MIALLAIHGFFESATTLALRSEGADPSSRLSMAIAGLLLLGLLVSVATIVFWRMTRPD
ncbi:unannotated protein [freshwater metagenome]|uniref:Unannotated protein n=1 Tax=freshwater metagenome TaxID=449393 RepID=A0A6J7HW36_9ZZZZ|nr:hypothetical protein [Actinomycetota bacterium]MSY79302.1 hypothetical protein [Actinomycetota bacterium]MTA63950.1 hypothetical protein [Actinomycetota bacterium]